MDKIHFAFFGQDEFSVLILKELQQAGFTPDLVVTGPDRKVGRNQTLTPPPAKVWAQANGVPIEQPERITPVFIGSLTERNAWDVFVVASYGQILPRDLIELPKNGTLNVHPSLLPLLRGADPIRTAILQEEKTGVTIMQIDERMDHGPIVAKRDVAFDEWPTDYCSARDHLASVGGKLLAEVMHPFINGDITPTPQNHGSATYTNKVSKEDGELDIENGDPLLNWKKYLAYISWPGTYFFVARNGKQMRLKITEATFENGEFKVVKVIPEGKKEMLYADFLKG